MPAEPGAHRDREDVQLSHRRQPPRRRQPVGLAVGQQRQRVDRDAADAAPRRAGARRPESRGLGRASPVAGHDHRDHALAPLVVGHADDRDLERPTGCSRSGRPPPGGTLTPPLIPRRRRGRSTRSRPSSSRRPRSCGDEPAVAEHLARCSVGVAVVAVEEHRAAEEHLAVGVDVDRRPRRAAPRRTRSRRRSRSCRRSATTRTPAASASRPQAPGRSGPPPTSTASKPRAARSMSAAVVEQPDQLGRDQRDVARRSPLAGRRAVLEATGSVPAAHRAEEDLEPGDVRRGQVQHPLSGAAEARRGSRAPRRASRPGRARPAWGCPSTRRSRRPAAPGRRRRPSRGAARGSRSAVPRTGAGRTEGCSRGITLCLPESDDCDTPAQWLEGARPRTLPAAVSPVLAGTGVAAYVDQRGVVEGGARPGRVAGPAGRGELRQRLLRRDPRHRRGPGRPAAARRVAHRHPAGGQDGRSNTFISPAVFPVFGRPPRPPRTTVSTATVQHNPVAAAAHTRPPQRPIEHSYEPAAAAHHHHASVSSTTLPFPSRQRSKFLATTTTRHAPQANNNQQAHQGPLAQTTIPHNDSPNHLTANRSPWPPGPGGGGGAHRRPLVSLFKLPQVQVSFQQQYAAVVS